VLPEGDKIEHVIAYAVLSILCYRAFCRSARPQVGRHAALLTVLVAFSFGIFCEWYQTYLPFRSADTWDLAANGFGSLLAIWSTTFQKAGRSRPSDMVCEPYPAQAR
jgi:VanZ family protein